MAEKYDAKNGIDKNTFFNHLLLSGELSELTKRDDFNSSDLEVDLRINGVQVKIEDFNNVLEDWSNRIAGQLKDELKLNESRDAVVQKAEDLIKSRLGNIFYKLEEVESVLWKLEEL